jgi:hypothetical protein
MQAPQSKIYDLRGYKVILDHDIARLYGTDRQVLHLALRQHAAEFPEDFLFQLTTHECYRLDVTPPVYAFTALGLTAAGSFLKSGHAIKMHIAVIRCLKLPVPEQDAALLPIQEALQQLLNAQM